ncbi:MAG TPA: GDP-L-fucose synthase [Stellaceae bacterium]|nr:GDP-L-fucose synthase [Stellaceae bacterium]
MTRLDGRRIFLAGHRGMVGSALMRRLKLEKCEVLTAPRREVDLRDPAATRAFMEARRPELVMVAAARVGGILANDTRPAEFLYDNLMIAANVIEAAHRVGVEKLLFLGSSCIYPRLAPQPMREEYLLSGPLEPTNQWYAIAKIAGLKLCAAYRRQYGCDFIAAQPTNLYGPGDTYDLKASHVVPALIAKMHAAKERAAPMVEIWGSGRPRREFLHVDDLADALVFLMKNYSGEDHINVGTGTDVTILELARIIAGVVGFAGDFRFDAKFPDGTPRKLLDITRLTELGWQARIPLGQGIEDAYRWFLETHPHPPTARRVVGRTPGPPLSREAGEGAERSEAGEGGCRE